MDQASIALIGDSHSHRWPIRNQIAQPVRPLDEAQVIIEIVLEPKTRGRGESVEVGMEHGRICLVGLQQIESRGSNRVGMAEGPQEPSNERRLTRAKFAFQQDDDAGGPLTAHLRRDSFGGPRRIGPIGRQSWSLVALPEVDFRLGPESP